MTTDTKFTPVESRMLDVLSDGMAHTGDELHACLWDTDGDRSNIRTHLANLRRKLRPKGHDIVCIYIHGAAPRYRHVRLLKSPVE
jgi:hypothetical protein